MFKRRKRTYILSLVGRGSHRYINGYGPIPTVGDTVALTDWSVGGARYVAEGVVTSRMLKPQGRSLPVVYATIQHGELAPSDVSTLDQATDGYVHAS